MSRSGLAAVALWLLGLILLASCTQKKDENAPALPLSEQGKRVYLANCIACHNPDPTKSGAVGPAVAGSSLELITARVLEASYPPGYKPKRESKAMAALPQLKGELPALQAFLAAP